MAKELHATASEIGRVSTVYGLASVVAIPFLAWALDRGSPRRLIMTAAFALSASACGYLAVDRVGPFLLMLRLVQGLAWALTFTAGMMMTTSLAPAERLAQAIGFYGSANLAMKGFAGFLVARGLPEIVNGRAESTTGMWSLASRPQSLWMAAVGTLWGAAFGAMFTFSQPFALELGITHVRGFFIAYTAAALFSRLGIGSLADRAGRLRVSVGALSLYATVVLSMQHLRPGWLTPIGGFFGFAHGLFFPAFSALTLARLPNVDRGKLTALSNGAFCGGMALSGALFGPLAEHSGYPRVFLVAGLATWGAVAMLATGRV
jgi:predicted MFS family arabinose efflux permease